MLPRRMVVERIARLVEAHIVRQLDRQLGCRDGLRPAGVAMDHGDRTAPEPLTRDQPVAQPELHAPLGHGLVAAGVCLFEPARHLVERGHWRHAVEKAGVDHNAVVDIGLVDDLEGRGVVAFRHHHRNHRQAVFVGKVEVALIARRTAEDGAGSVVHQHEIRDIDRQRPLRIERVHRTNTGVEAFLLGRLQRCGGGSRTTNFFDERREVGIGLGRLPRQRMIRRDRHERRAEDRVGPGRVDVERVLAGRRGFRVQRPADQQALRAADPVALHGPDLFRPAAQVVETVEQLLAHRGDLEEPLRQVALLHQRAGTPPAPVNDLLVGKHSHVDRVPVDLGRLALDQPGLPEIEEHLLLVLVV